MPIPSLSRLSPVPSIGPPFSGRLWHALDGHVAGQLSNQSTLFGNAGYDYGFELALQAL